MPRIAIGLALLFLAASAASAQKQCRKGVPCGGTCISATKSCHVAAQPKQSAAVQDSAAKPVVDATAATVPSSSDAASVGSSRGHSYYKAGCSGANKLALKNRVYFKTEAEAKKAGYTRSGQRGC